jgi:hypothetical protein
MGAIDTLSSADQIQAIYVGYYGRAGDPGGMSYWELQYATDLANGHDASYARSDIAQGFWLPQQETLNTYPSAAGLPSTITPPTTPAQNTAIHNFVDAVYHNIFNHGLAAGDTYWEAQIEQGKVSFPNAILFIENGAIGSDATILHNKIAVADEFTHQSTLGGWGFDNPLPPQYAAEAHSVVVQTTATNEVAMVGVVDSFFHTYHGG